MKPHENKPKILRLSDEEYQRDVAQQKRDDSEAMAICARCLSDGNKSRALHLAAHDREPRVTPLERAVSATEIEAEKTKKRGAMSLWKSSQPEAQQCAKERDGQERP